MANYRLKLTRHELRNKSQLGLDFTWGSTLVVGTSTTTENAKYLSQGIVLSKQLKDQENLAG